jgi:flavin-binding protein dodecin
VAEPFGRRPPAGARWLARVFGTHVKSGAIAEIEALLGSAPRVRSVSPQRVAEVAARYRVDLGQRFPAARGQLYRRLLEHCLVDCALSAEESADLAHLKALLALGDAEAARIHDEVAVATYGAAVAQVLADQRLDPEERAFLERLGKDLELPPAAADDLYRRGAEESRRRFVARTQAHDSALVASKSLELDLEGSSEVSLEAAIRAALEEAGRAVPGLRSAEVRQIRTDVRDGRVTRWCVALRAGVGEGEEKSR